MGAGARTQGLGQDPGIPPVGVDTEPTVSRAAQKNRIPGTQLTGTFLLSACPQTRGRKCAFTGWQTRRPRPLRTPPSSSLQPQSRRRPLEWLAADPLLGTRTGGQPPPPHPPPARPGQDRAPAHQLPQGHGHTRGHTRSRSRSRSQSGSTGLLRPPTPDLSPGPPLGPSPWPSWDPSLGPLPRASPGLVPRNLSCDSSRGPSPGADQGQVERGPLEPGGSAPPAVAPLSAPRNIRFHLANCAC